MGIAAKRAQLSRQAIGYRTIAPQEVILPSGATVDLVAMDKWLTDPKACAA